ncbi:hypothetical protein [Effusibacillus consociatus]|uniref:Transposase n=1 Tax=Effusibacillus consociatus TaxID=1117041 RepID=A0ABV9Q7W1_9BACL
MGATPKIHFHGYRLNTADEREVIRQMLLESKNCLNCGTRLPRGHGYKRKQGYCSADCYQAKPPKMALLEKIHGKPIREIVVEELNRNHTSMDVVAQLLGIQKFALYQWIKKLRIRQVVRWE